MAHYCQGVLAGDTVYAAGQIASDYKTGVPPQARQDPAFPFYGGPPVNPDTTAWSASVRNCRLSGESSMIRTTHLPGTS